MGSGDATNEFEEEATLNIRCSNGSKLLVQLKLNSTVEFFKSVLAEKCSIPPHQQRLIYKGRILKDDQTLHSYGVEEDHTVYLVQGFATSAPLDSASAMNSGVPNTNQISMTDVDSNEGRSFAASGFGSTLFSGFGLNGSESSGLFGSAIPEVEDIIEDPDMMRDFFEIPIVRNLMNDPEIIRNIITSNPQMREVMDRNPELAHVINDPATLRQTMQAARNPELMREMTRQTDRAISNIESSPEGFNMLRRMYEDVQEPFLNATAAADRNISDLGSNRFATFIGSQGGGLGRENVTSSVTTGRETTTSSPTPNTNPLPNPWASAGGGTQINLNARSSSTGGAMLTPLGGLHGLDFPTTERMRSSLLSSPQHMNQDELQILDQALLSQFGRQLASQDLGQNATATAGSLGNMGFDSLRNMIGGLGFNAQNRPRVPPEEQYSTQLSQLTEMGFFDAQENIRALIATAGNVNAAVERLLGNTRQ